NSPYACEYSGSDVYGAWPAAARTFGMNFPEPPIWLSWELVHGISAPVAPKVHASVLPKLSTSGPLPLTVAARILVSSVDQGRTCRFTLIPVSLVNLFSSGVRTVLSACRLAPWWVAQ